MTPLTLTLLLKSSPKLRGMNDDVSLIDQYVYLTGKYATHSNDDQYVKDSRPYYGSYSDIPLCDKYTCQSRTWTMVTISDTEKLHWLFNKFHILPSGLNYKTKKNKKKLSGLGKNTQFSHLITLVKSIYDEFTLMLFQTCINFIQGKLFFLKEYNSFLGEQTKI